MPGGTVPAACNICGVLYCTIICMRRHKLEVHGVEPGQPAQTEDLADELNRTRLEYQLEHVMNMAEKDEEIRGMTQQQATAASERQWLEQQALVRYSRAAQTEAALRHELAETQARLGESQAGAQSREWRGEEQAITLQSQMVTAQAEIIAAGRR